MSNNHRHQNVIVLSYNRDDRHRHQSSSYEMNEYEIVG